MIQDQNLQNILKIFQKNIDLSSKGSAEKNNTRCILLEKVKEILFIKARIVLKLNSFK